MGDRLAAELARAGLELRHDDEGLVLAGDGMELRASFAGLASRIAGGRLHRELVVRAAKVRGAGAAPTLVDATAGLGEDSFLLAAVGFSVTLFESNPVIAALLADAVSHAADDPRLADAARRMHVVEADSIAALRALDKSPDVVYLDPMFPERRKSAAVKKKFQLLHRLEAPCDDEEALLAAAFAARPRKIIVKRPLKGPVLAGVAPSYALSGKAIRFDCIVPTSQSDGTLRS